MIEIWLEVTAVGTPSRNRRRVCGSGLVPSHAWLAPTIRQIAAIAAPFSVLRCGHLQRAIEALGQRLTQAGSVPPPG
jgi:hypothetical protein